MKNAVKILGLVGLLGGLGGAIVAWLRLWYAPEVIRAGALHGALLAVIAVGFSVWLWQRRPLVRWLFLPAVGWLSGWLSSIPIVRLFPFPFPSKGVFRGFLWPFGPGIPLLTFTLWGPFAGFGLVGTVYFLFLAVFRQLSRRSPLAHILLAILSGTLGSLWWWILWKPWYFSVLHGTIWGSLVGFGVWRSQRWLHLGNDSADR